MSESYYFSGNVEQYNLLLNKLIIQARNDYDQFYEVKDGDQKKTTKSKPVLSKLSTKIISELNEFATTFYNKIYYAMTTNIVCADSVRCMNQSECNCGNTHNHNDYAKVSAKLKNTFLEIDLHYLLEPFTQTKLSWKVISKTDEGDIPQYIMIRVCMIS